MDLVSTSCSIKTSLCIISVEWIGWQVENNRNKNQKPKPSLLVTICTDSIPEGMSQQLSRLFSLCFRAVSMDAQTQAPLKGSPEHNTMQQQVTDQASHAEHKQNSSSTTNTLNLLQIQFTVQDISTPEFEERETGPGALLEVQINYAVSCTVLAFSSREGELSPMSLRQHSVLGWIQLLLLHHTPIHPSMQQLTQVKCLLDFSPFSAMKSFLNVFKFTITAHEPTPPTISEVTSTVSAT